MDLFEATFWPLLTSRMAQSVRRLVGSSAGLHFHQSESANRISDKVFASLTEADLGRWAFDTVKQKTETI